MNGKKVGYIRVSTNEQAEHGYSLEYQKGVIEQYFNSNNIKDYTILIDDGYSATNEDRPKYLLLKSRVLSGSVNEIVVYKMDRLHRNVSDSNNFIQLCLKNKIELKSISEQLNYNTAMGRAMGNITSSIAQLESELISERTKNGIYAKAILGRYPYKSCPYGYVKDKLGNLEVESIKGEIVKYIFFNINYKPQKLLNNIYDMFEVKLNYKTLENIRHKYKFYFTGKIEVQGVDVKIVDPLIENKYILRKVLKYIYEDKSKYIKEIAAKEYKYYGKVYYEDRMLHHKSAYGKQKRKYFYYVDKKCNIWISQNKIDLEIEQSRTKKLVHQKDDIESLYNKFINCKITENQLLFELNQLKVKRIDDIIRVDINKELEVKIIYK